MPLAADLFPADVDALPARVKALMDPAAYPDPPSDIEFIETHRAWVFRTGTFAYKLLKPAWVDAPNDHRSPHSREHLDAQRRDAATEVTVNRRLAPSVYLGIRPVTATVNGFTVGDDGEVVDWLIWMKQLPDADALPARMAADRLSTRDLRSVAQTLLDFYSRAEPADVTPFGYINRLARTMEYNTFTLSRLTYRIPTSLIENVATALDAALHEQVGALSSRSQFVVDAHGDLRPEHVYVLDEPVMIDGLAFDRSLRELDPVHELAFLCLQCAREGQTDVRNVLVSMYEEHTGVAIPPGLVAFYQAHEAVTRARLIIRHLDHDGASTDAGRRWRTRAEADLRIALRLLRGERIR